MPKFKVKCVGCGKKVKLRCPNCRKRKFEIVQDEIRREPQSKLLCIHCKVQQLGFYHNCSKLSELGSHTDFRLNRENFIEK